jgi:hypothetical protein
MLEDREMELKNMTYNPNLPINVVFNAVADFADFSELGNQPLTQWQTVAKTYLILNKTRRFKNDITEWNRKPDIQKNWINFKDHFRRAHQEFRETTNTTVEEFELQRNNANLVQQVVDGLQQAIRPDDSAELLEQMASHTTCPSKQLLAQLHQMQHSMVILQTQVTAQQHNPTNFQQPNQAPAQHHNNTNFQQQPYQRQPFQQQQFFPMLLEAVEEVVDRLWTAWSWRSRSWQKSTTTQHINILLDSWRMRSHQHPMHHQATRSSRCGYLRQQNGGQRQSMPTPLTMGVW